MSLRNRIRQLWSLVKHRTEFVNAVSYYPDCEHKKRMQIFFDQLHFINKLGGMEPFYFAYGFDRKEMSRKRIKEEYLLPYGKFQNNTDFLNWNNPKHGKYTGRVITADKFYFNIFLERFNIPTPKILCYIKDGSILYLDKQFVIDSNLQIKEQLKLFFSNNMDAFAKPSGGQLGTGIFALRIKDQKIYIDGKVSDVNHLIDIVLSANYLIQKRVYQHPILNQLCDSTINSIRLQTVMDKEGVVHPFGAGLRIGRKGSSVDNWAKGGVFVGIDMENGRLMETGFLKPKFGTSVKEHPDTHVVFNGFEIPFYKDAEQKAVQLHQRLYRCHSVGWDIAITEEGPVFIEGNGLWEISLIQAAHGGLKKQIEKYFF